jgi:2-polyprenyl-3-methyl-5-hydroxy-6-metoxy-1,4-benzoquinol methylase
LQACLPGLFSTEAGRFIELRDHSRQRWDSLSAWWDEQSGDDGHADTRDILLPICLRLLQPKPGDRLIDAGCGNGWIARRLARAGASVAAFDFSANLLELARKRDTGRLVEYRQIDATLPDQLAALGHHTADGAICYMALMDIADIKPLMEAMRRAIRPGGHFVFAMIHPDDTGLSKAVESQAFTNLGKANQPVEHYYFHRPLPLLLDVFEKAGWEVDQLASPSSPTGARFLVGRLNTGAG